MARIIYQLFYGIRLRYIITSMIIIVFLWCGLRGWACNKLDKSFRWKETNFLVAIVSIVIICVMTLSSRSNSSELILIPFHSFIEAKKQPEMYRSMLMNVFLFFPLGLSLPYAFPEKWKPQVLWSIFLAMILSTSIEFIQYHYQLGRTEVDDIICNTLGCAIGNLSYCISAKLRKKDNNETT